MQCINTDDLWQHMQAFWQIAQDNPGPDGHPSRNSGEPGHRLDAMYGAGMLDNASGSATILDIDGGPVAAKKLLWVAIWCQLPK